MLPSACSEASVHSESAVASRSGSGEAARTTVMRFSVRVPVLSVQTALVQPSVSTAVRRRTIAPFFDIRVTPSESTTVTTAASPSGIAATARLTASIKVSSSTV